MSQGSQNRSSRLPEAHSLHGAHHDQEDSWKAGQLGKGLGERAENLKLSGRKWHCKQKIAGHGELVPFTLMNATQIQSQGPSVSRAELCSGFEQEKRCHSESHWIV